MVVTGIILETIGQEQAIQSRKKTTRGSSASTDFVSLDTFLFLTATTILSYGTFKLEQGRFSLGVRKKLFTIRVVRHGTGCLWKSWMLNSCKHIRSGWLKL